MSTKDEKINKTQVSELVSEYRWDSLDEHYEVLKDSENKEQKEILAEGYLSYFSQLSYDFMCGKISEGEVSFFLDIVEKAENLLDKKLWYFKGIAYNQMMDRSLEEGHISDFYLCGSKGIEALLESINAGDNDPEDNFNLIAQNYFKFSTHLTDGQMDNWIKSIQYLRSSIDINPQEANWRLYIEILNTNKILDKSFTKELEIKKKNFEELINDLDKTHFISPLIAKAYLEYREHIEFYKWDLPFPEDEYLAVLEKALLAKVTNTSYFSAIDLANFFHKEGVRLRRTDVLSAAIQYYNLTVGKQEDRAYGIRSIAKTYEDISNVYKENLNELDANIYLDKALYLLKENIKTIILDFSPLSFYTEFLERCYIKTWYRNKPSLSEVKKYAEMTVQATKGYNLSGIPTYVRTLLIEGKEDEAILVLTRHLLMHESCLDKEFIQFKEADFKELEKFNSFINETLIFFQKISEDYYYDPVFKWEDVEKMTNENILESWELRKVEILTRPRPF